MSVDKNLATSEQVATLSARQRATEPEQLSRRDMALVARLRAHVLNNESLRPLDVADAADRLEAVIYMLRRVRYAMHEEIGASFCHVIDELLAEEP